MTIRLNHFRTRVVLYPLLGVAVSAFLISLGLKFDLSKSDWASWVQAIGSVAALAVAMIVMLWQNRLNAAAREKAELMHQLGLLVAANHCAMRLNTALKALHGTLSHQGQINRSNFNFHRATLNSLIGAMERIPMWEISSSASIEMGTIQVLCSSMINILEENQANDEANRAHLAKQVSQYWEMAQEKAKGFRDAFEEVHQKIEAHS